MCGEEGERRNKDGGPDGGCKLGPYQYIRGFRGGGYSQRTIQMPAWAIIAVPGAVKVSICCLG